MTSDDWVYMRLGKSVRARRERIGLTQEELAARVGLLRTSISNIEHGRQKIQVHTLCALAEALGVTPIALLPTPFDDRDLAEVQAVPGDLLPSERAWVERVLANRGRTT